jgi:aspartate/methionine/tyrosine aminotransferase
LTSGFATRLDGLGASAINDMIRLGERYGAINLASGDPQFEPPRQLLLAVKEAVEGGHNALLDSWGAPEFRRSLAEKQSKYMGFPIDPDDNITVTCGATEAITGSVMAICDPGDLVITFSPFYEVHTAAPILSGCELAYVPLRFPNQSFDFQELREAAQRGAKAILICNPSNPSGKVFSLQELELVAEVAREFDLYVITDEVYEHFAYPPHSHTYISSLADMFERTISCSALSKTYNVTGWRLGYAIAPQRITQQIRKIHDYLTCSAPEPLIWGALAGLQFPASYYEDMLNKYMELRDILCCVLDETGLNYIRPQGAFFILVDVSPLGFDDDLDLCHWLAKEAKVVVAPGSSFFHEPVSKYVRLSFSRPEATLRAAGDRLLSAIHSRGISRR